MAVALIVDPERLLEPLAERLGLGPKACRKVVLAAERRETGHPALRVEDVALDLGQGDRRRGEATGTIADRVAGVLPALVQEASLGPPLVLDEPVAVAVAVAVD